jgi:hypothetical protein
VTRIRKKIKGRQERRRKDNKDKENKDDKGDKDKQNKDPKPNENGEPKPAPGGISKERLEKLIDAVNKEEKKVQDKVNAKKVKGNQLKPRKIGNSIRQFEMKDVLHALF